MCLQRMVNAQSTVYDQIYMEGNIGVHRIDDTMDEWLEVGNNSNPTAQSGRSFTAFATPIQPQSAGLPDAVDLEAILLDDVGANLNPDVVDNRVINDVINRTPTTAKTVQGTDPNEWNGATTYYGIINDPSEVGGWPTLAPMNSIVPDTNNDGIDDNWASTHGVSSWDDILSDYCFSNMQVINNAGYTARQIYLAWLAEDFERLPHNGVCDADNNGMPDGCEGCEDEVIIMTSPVITTDISANIRIITNGIVAAGNSVDYYAGESVELLANFEVEIGAVFHGYIAPCQ